MATPELPATQAEDVTGTLEVLSRPQRVSRLRRLLHELRWKILAARFVISVGAVMLTILIVPGISVKEGNFFVWTTILGAVFFLINALVKPVLQVVTIRYLFLSYGLIVVAIDIVTFALLDLIVERLNIENVFELILGGVLLGLLVTVLENLLGVTPPIVDPRAEADDDPVALHRSRLPWRRGREVA